MFGWDTLLLIRIISHPNNILDAKNINRRFLARWEWADVDFHSGTRYLLPNFVPDYFIGSFCIGPKFLTKRCKQKLIQFVSLFESYSTIV